MKKAKNVSKIITIILLVSIILRFCYVIIHINHDCNHDDTCPICTIINKFKEDINGFNPNIIKEILAIIVIFPPIVRILKIIKNRKEETLIGLKVRLDS